MYLHIPFYVQNPQMVNLQSKAAKYHNLEELELFYKNDLND